MKRFKSICQLRNLIISISDVNTVDLGLLKQMDGRIRRDFAVRIWRSSITVVAR